MAKEISIVALISGGGRTVINILDQIESSRLPARIQLVIASRDDAKGLQRCELRGIKTAVVPSKEYRSDGTTDWQAMSDRVNSLILATKPDLVILAGYMCMHLIPDELDGKIMNIHPALLPAFSGHNMWGKHVHNSAIKAGVKISGCTVHFVNNEYDKGPIILQRTCVVKDTDTADNLADRVFMEECRAYPEAIKLYAEGKLKIKGKIVKIQTQAFA